MRRVRLADTQAEARMAQADLAAALERERVLVGENAILQVALAFYADSANWEWRDDMCKGGHPERECYCHVPTEDDEGTIARAALAETAQGEP